MRRDLGDFQTPPALVAAVLETLGRLGRTWSRALEPSCGRGHFLEGLLALEAAPRELQGIEIQESHAAAARAVTAGSGGTRILRANLFELDLRRDLAWSERGPLLVVGNPPWVTSAELGALGSGNLPPKHNLKGFKGLEARTGASNFDIAEGVWLKLLEELADESPTIALLCKTAVARNVLEFADRAGIPLADASVHKIDAPAWFGASVDACLFVVSLGTGLQLEHIPVFGQLGDRCPKSEWGLIRGRLVGDLSGYRRFAAVDGSCPVEWRQGIKHDAAGVMELVRADGDGLRNRLGEPVDVEPEFVYPLLKGADLDRSVPDDVRRSVIVTQTRIGDDTRRLEAEAPRLFAYLQAHADAFAKRKSSIYRGQPPFSLFGIGPYSFAPYKVAVSGLHRTPRFRAVGPVGGRPVMLDDTCYFLPCTTAAEAALVSVLLNDTSALGLLTSLIFPGAKRPVTKRILRRLDLKAIESLINPEELRERVKQALADLEPRSRNDAGIAPAESMTVDPEAEQLPICT